ncbi:MAG: hypothetical protein ACLRTD_25150 [Bacteroides sp.]
MASTLQRIADTADYDQLILVQKQAIATADENIANIAQLHQRNSYCKSEKLIASLENIIVMNPIYNDYLARSKLAGAYPAE